MEKFFSIMYDFFAFSLPGVLIIMFFFTPFQLSENNDGLAATLNNLEFSSILLLAVAGYVVGYIITPIARFTLLLGVAYGVAWLVYKLFQKIKFLRFVEQRKFVWNDNRPKEFIRIREKRPNCQQYIQFWSMHLTMAHNLAFAFIVGFVLCIIKECMFPGINMWGKIGVFILPAIILAWISYKFSCWWYSDIKEALKS